MTAYVLAFALPILLFPLRKLKRYAFVVALSLGWSLFAGLRLGIGGNDYFAYEEFFKALRGLSFASAAGRFEPLFKWLGLMSKSLGLGFHGFLSLTALLAVLPAVYVVDRHSGDSPVALFVFGVEWMFYGSFVILRQSIAMGLGFLAYDALEEKRYRTFFLLGVLAFGFHYSALVLLVLPFFQKELDWRLRSCFFIVAFTALVGLEFILNTDITLWSNYGFLNKLLLYFPPGGSERLNFLNIPEIVALSVLILRYVSPQRPLLRNAYFIYICFAVLALQDAIFIRFGWYFEIAIAFLLPGVIREAWKRRYEGVVVSLGLFLYYSAKTARWLVSNGSGLGGFLPYHWILG